MLQTAKPDKKARQSTVLRGGVEVLRLRRAPAPSGEGIAADLGDSTWVFAGTWHGHYRVGEVTGRPTETTDDNSAPRRARHAGDNVRDIVLEGRRLEISRKSLLTGMHRCTERGGWLAETGVVGFFRARITQTLGFNAVPVPGI